MITMLKNWPGSVEVDGVSYDTVEAFRRSCKPFENDWHIKLLPRTEKRRTDEDKRSEVHPSSDHQEFKITVKKYMTERTREGSSFNFMQKFNDDNPMPLRTMVGWKEKETRGMVYMHLHGQGQEEICCMRCGRRLTHPVSRHYGIGPECMSKLGIVADIEDVDDIKEQLINIEWTGWIIKSAIISSEEV